MTVRNPLKRSTIPGRTSTKRSMSAVDGRPADGDRAASGRRRRPSPRARATARASRTSTTSPSAPRRRAGRARAGSARPRRLRRRRTTGGAASPRRRRRRSARRRGSASTTGRGPRRSARAGVPLPPSTSTSAHAAPNPTHAGTSSMPAAPGPLLRAADEERRDAQPAAHEQRAGALRAAPLVRGHRAQVGAERGEVDRDVAGRRARVDVHEHAARRVPRAHTSAAGCTRADLVVGELHRRRARCRGASRRSTSAAS